MWAARGSRPVAPKQTAYANLHVLSAVCPATGAAEGLVAESLDARTVQALLDQLSASLPGGVHVVFVWDGAGYHPASEALRVPANVTPVTPPPHPPELNPVERPWLYIREHYWANRVYKDFAAPERAALDAWRRVCLDAGRIRTLCRCEYLPAGS